MKQSILSKLDIDEQYEVSKQIEADIRADERKKAFKEVGNKIIAPFEREMAILNRVEWSQRNLACFVFRIQEIVEQMKGEQK